MGKALVQVIDGITYPREVPIPEGLPEGWKGIEQAYGPGSALAGQTYVRYSSRDGRHKSVGGAKQIIQKHSADLGLPWEPEWAAYEAGMETRRLAAMEAKGKCDPAKRDAMVAVSRAKFGELTGPICLAFPGWKCRWDYLPDSGQTPKTFLAADGRDWKLLMDIECFFGMKLTAGGQQAEDIIAMVEAGQANYAAQELFSGGSSRAKECQGSYLLDPANPDESQVVSAAEVAQRKADRKTERTAKKQKLGGGKDSLYNLSVEVVPIQEDWAALKTAADIPKAFVEFKSLLLKRGFQQDLEFIAVHGVSEACRHASRISGIYYRMPTDISNKRCYQKLLSNPRCSRSVCCDGVYIWWNAPESRWEISLMPTAQAACVAYCIEDKNLVTDVSETWQVQHQGNGDFEAENSLNIVKFTQ